MHGSRERWLAAIAACVALAVPSAALAAFPGADPHESPRLNTPNDPGFDECEPVADGGDGNCSIYNDEQYQYFGFSPESANQLPGLPHQLAATQYVDCAQLDAQGRDANEEAGDPQCSQISGVRADTAWKYSTGTPDVKIAILDTGIRWQDSELVNKVALNRDELPLPQQAGGAACAAYDCNGDGAFDVRDYADDPRVTQTAGDQESDGIRDASDLIATFSNGTDSDSNGYVDDIAGWDFFDDDNDPFDASSCCSAGGHGTGRAKEALAEGNNGSGEIGMCPGCQLMPLRVWDTFVVPGDNFAMGVTYATANGASVVEGAVGGLSNTQFARRAFEFADARGVTLTLVSSDINSANHNYPTNYNEAIYVGGSIYDTAPNETCSGPGGLPGVGDIVDPPDEFSEGCEAFLDLLGGQGITPHAPGQPITTSFFRNSNLTQYGGKADIVLMGSTGSENTGKASGAAGLLASFGRETFGAEDMLSGNEIRQLLTMTAEDVMPANTGFIGQPDKAQVGWDPHFGYGRVNLAAAMARIANDPHPETPAGAWPCQFTGPLADPNCVPPEAQIDAPDWFSPINVDRLPGNGMAIRGRALAPHSNSAARVGHWRLEWACGQDATDSSFTPVPEVGGGSIEGDGEVNGVLGRIPRSALESRADNCDGSVTNDAGRPAGAVGWPANPYPEPDPERHAFQIRFTVPEADDPGNFGRYRKTLFAYRDDGNLSGWPKAVGAGSDQDELITGSGGEVPPRLYDLDGDNQLDVLLGTSSGELHVLDSAGQPLQSFNGGQPVRTNPLALAAGRIPAGLPVPREPLRAPAIGDIAGDRRQEIVASAGEHVYAWHADGGVVAGFPVRIDPDLSEPCIAVPKPCFATAERRITTQNHIKRGFAGSPALADLDGDGRLDIVVGSLDQHVYAWDGDGDLLPVATGPGSPSANGDGHYPVKLQSAGADGAEIFTSPAVADLDGDGKRDEVILATNEVIGGDSSPPDDFPAPQDLLNILIGAATGSNPVYAINGDGTAVPGWPVPIGVAAGDLLPLVLPGHDAAVLDVDGDGNDEASLSAGTSLSAAQGSKLVDGDGSTVSAYANAAAAGPDQGPVLNLADYSSIGDTLGTGTPQVFKGGLTVNGAANLLAVNQNLPFSHVVQAWDPQTGAALPGYPRATDDFQLVSQPAVARVSGTGPARQTLYGTGLYQLHAYGAGGVEATNPLDPAASWPKFTGGWTQATPSVGDADGDGKLDVVAVTREGWSFLWGTEAPACEDAAGTTNEEWWTFHHDEFGTANYGTDARPPGSAEDLAVSSTAGGATLTWKAPGDDWLCGQSDHYEVRMANGPIDDPGDGQIVAAENDTAATGEIEERALTAAELGDATHLAVLYRDEAGNWGHLASVSLAPDPDPGPGPPGGGDAGGGDGGGGPAGGDGAGGGGGSGGGGPAGGGGPTGCANVIDGTGKRDFLRGTESSDRIRTGKGDDSIDGAGGADCIDAGNGSDKAYGGRGADKVGGDDGRDRLRGDGGKDRIIGGDGRDRVKAGGGSDTVRVGSDGTRDRVDCGKGKDTAIVDEEDRVRNCEELKRP